MQPFGLSNHPDHEVARRQLRGFGGMVCFEHAAGISDGLACFSMGLEGPSDLIADFEQALRASER
jgi:cystathionine beta-lyase/cystathionine gamma-synthase